MGGKADAAKIAEAARVLRRGGLVAFPTETVYGLGANALDARAVRGIFRAKGRSSDNPLIVHLADARDLPRVAREVSPPVRRLARRFWPGPLTLVVPRHRRVPLATTAGLDTVAVRVPGHPVARALIRAAGVPIAAPSANLSGRPSLTSPEHLIAELMGRVDVLLLAGPSRIGVESTVIDLVRSPPTVLRAGGLPVERLRPWLPDLWVSPEAEGARPRGSTRPRSPGMKYRHYAPHARVALFEGPLRAVARTMRIRAASLARRGRRVRVLVPRESPLRGASVRVLGSAGRPHEIARHLYTMLRDADRDGATDILVQGIPAHGLGLAVMDRLRRAAAERQVDAPGRQGPGRPGRGEGVPPVGLPHRRVKGREEGGAKKGETRRAPSVGSDRPSNDGEGSARADPHEPAQAVPATALDLRKIPADHQT